MIGLSKSFFVRIVAFVTVTFWVNTTQAQNNENIDWKAFIAEQDLYWEVLPKLWDEAPFVGNGQMGSMLFKQDDHNLVIQIGRGDVQEHRDVTGIEAANNVLPDASRVPVGYFTLKTLGNLIDCKLRLNLWDAEISGTIRTDKGKLEIQAFLHSEKNLLVYKVNADEAEEGFSFHWHSEEAFCPRVKGKRENGGNYREPYDGNPIPIIEELDAYSVCTQDMKAGGQTATAWTILGGGKSKTLFASVEHTFPEENAKDKAIKTITEQSKTSLKDLLKGHREWWHKFYPKSFVSLPDARMQSFFWIQHYKMASTTKGGTLLADNQGVWMQPVTGWPGLWWNLNVQLAYSHMLPANHPELSEGLVNILYKYRENLAKNVPEEMQYNSAAINTVSGQHLISKVNDPRVKDGVSVGNFTWVMHNAYMQYRYTMDEELLREKIFPLLKRAINFYFHIMIEGDDGKIHLPLTSSPEYGNAKDCNYDLALLRWGCQTLIESCKILHLNDPLVPKWKDVLERLTPYPVDETGLMIGKDVPYAKSHRHYSQLLMLYPLSIMDLEDPEQLALAKKSVEHWQSFPEALAGYSYSGSSSMYSLFGDGEMAEKRLQQFFEDKILPNTFYKEGSPVIETPPAAARSIEDMLIQSWGDRIRVFPAIPAKWGDVAFSNLRTEGAFLVSAARNGGKTSFIKVKSMAGSPCRIQTGIEGEINVIGLDKNKVKELGNGILAIDLAKGEEVLISNDQFNGDYSISPVKTQFYSEWHWGCK